MVSQIRCVSRQWRYYSPNLTLKILSITANNATSNDTMMEELADLLVHFGGETRRTWCFLHVINLVVKMLIWQFDLPKANGGMQSTDDKLRKLAEDVDLEDLQIKITNGEGQDNQDNIEGWVNEMEFLMDNEHAELEQHLRPLHLILAKVSHCMSELKEKKTHCLRPQICKLLYKMIHSSTILLPVWMSTLKDLNIAPKHLLRDVSTCWNSTFDMLDCALRYRAGIDGITDKQKLGLSNYGLDEHKWVFLEQLHDVLKVHSGISTVFNHAEIMWQSRFSRMLRSSFPTEHPTLPWSSLPWISLMTCSLLVYSTSRTSVPQSTLLWASPKRP